MKISPWRIASSAERANSEPQADRSTDGRWVTPVQAELFGENKRFWGMIFVPLCPGLELEIELEPATFKFEFCNRKWFRFLVVDTCT